ncbi:MAG: glycosyltransferase family 9 protein [Nitrospinota bacterium]|nr:glycosyltransferase family 9 protein [Nitrospinota bacterium]
MPNTNLNENPRALIIKPSSFGDVIHALPVARAIKLAAPHVKVDWVISDSLTDLVAMFPYVDTFIPFKRARWTKWWRPSVLADIVAQVREARKKEYGAVIDLQGLLRSGLMTLACRAKVKVGFSTAREGAWLFYNDNIPVTPEAVHAVDRYMSALKALGIENNAGVKYDLVESEEDKAWAESDLPTEPFVAINPNARWAAKRWPLARFGHLCRELQKKMGYRIVIIGGLDDMADGARLALLAGDWARDLTGKTSPGRLAALLRRAKALFTNDSGPLHLAVAVGTPSVSFFGPTDPAKTGPYGPGHIVLRSGRECSPCFKKTCPYNHECMADIQVSTAVEAWKAQSFKEGKTGGRVAI